MNLRTELVVRPASWSLGLRDTVLTIGSCFAETIGLRLASCRFQTLANPFGTVYHPQAIHKQLSYAVHQEYPPDHTYLENQGITCNYDFHSSQSSPKLTSLQSKLHEQISIAHYALKNCKLLMLTYGTAWLYERKDTGETVANCHKMNASFFSKRLATVDEINISIRNSIESVLAINPQIKIILTVSPVRHIKDTLSRNNLSKSVLRVACHNMAEAFPCTEYFPAYEIMVDDLRDYRFYKNDFIHPTPLAENYIWEKFSETYFNKDTRAFIKQWDEIRTALHHKPFHPDGQAHQQFLAKTLADLENLKPVVNVDREIKEIKSRMIEYQPDR